MLHFYIRLALCLNLLICLGLNSPALANSRIKRQRQKAIRQGVVLLQQARRDVTRLYREFEELGKFQGVGSAPGIEARDKRLELGKNVTDRRTGVRLLQEQLTAAVDELYLVDTEIATIPEIVSFNERLLGDTSFFKEQSGFFEGPETLPCGTECSSSGSRRFAVAGMIDALAEDLSEFGRILNARAAVIVKFVGELDAIRVGRNADYTRFGLSYFVNQRLGVIASLQAVLEDINSLGRGETLDGDPYIVDAPCRTGEYAYTSILDDINLILRETEAFLGESRSWSSEILGPLVTDRFQSREDVSYLNAWPACYMSKENVIKDYKSKAEAEFRLGNLAASQRLDEETHLLEIHVIRLRAQDTRLRNLLALWKRLSTSAVQLELSLKEPSSSWKSIVYAQMNNFIRLVVVETDVLYAGRTLLRRAEEQFAGLGGELTKDDLDARLFATKTRLNTIVKRGFERLENEVKLAVESMKVMSSNIKLLEGANGEGGLGLAILAYEDIVRIRAEQMRNERDVELPRRRAEALALVEKLEADLEDAVNILRESERRLERFDVISKRAQDVGDSLEEFYAVEVAHPVYSALVDLYLDQLSRTRGYRKSIEKRLRRFVSTFETFEEEEPGLAALTTAVPRDRQPRISISSNLGKATVQVFRLYGSNIRKQIDEASVALLREDMTLSEQMSEYRDLVTEMWSL